VTPCRRCLPPPLQLLPLADASSVLSAAAATLLLSRQAASSAEACSFYCPAAAAASSVAAAAAPAVTLLLSRQADCAAVGCSCCRRAAAATLLPPPLPLPLPPAPHTLQQQHSKTTLGFTLRKAGRKSSACFTCFARCLQLLTPCSSTQWRWARFDQLNLKLWLSCVTLFGFIAYDELHQCVQHACSRGLGKTSLVQ
jgi:hypothetical protein